ncbi:MAG TPA: hypothetical protein VGF43_10760 [Dongiaceae bacterium]|jgi:hypothetical protein
MQRRALLRIALIAPALLAPPIAAFADTARNDAASKAALAFLKALRKKDIDSALQFIDAPFVAEDQQLLATEDDVKAYLAAMLANADPAELPNEVLAVLDYDESRAATAGQALKLRDAVLDSGDLLVATGRNGLSRGVLLVKCGGEKPVVVGVGY